MMATTTAETATMQAGRELDAQVAECVMGLPVCDTPALPPALRPCSLAGTEHFARDDAGIPAYSTDMAAAWLVVERLIEDGWLPDVQLNDWGAESWHVTLTRRVDDDRTGYHAATATTAPLAICRVAMAVFCEEAQ